MKTLSPKIYIKSVAHVYYTICPAREKEREREIEMEKKTLPHEHTDTEGGKTQET